MENTPAPSEPPDERPDNLPREPHRDTPPAHTRLDSYVDRYAARTAGMTASEIRALFAVASRPEVVSLAGGMPNISGLPLDVVGSAIGDLIADHGATALQYGSGQGDPRLREQICDVMRLEGIDAHPDDVVVTVGSQQAVDLVTRIFCDPGDVVLCEAPSYVGALGVFKSFQCDVVHVEMDADGLVPDALRQAITAVKAAGKTIKFLYTIPNFHNPAGNTLSAHRRPEILEICREHDILVLAGNLAALFQDHHHVVGGAAAGAGVQHRRRHPAIGVVDAEGGAPSSRRPRPAPPGRRRRPALWSSSTWSARCSPRRRGHRRFRGSTQRWPGAGPATAASGRARARRQAVA